ncbi:VOC family protein [Pseudoalteromonas sp. TAB23]|uniref:VOC family protein n=1 Tax=Pseudoalteromonas sp. TAB23 TaxID=1938595 RepID=UPI0004099C83|nr:VOC family protein [Pseudoalteromonas sp. TAB23]
MKRIGNVALLVDDYDKAINYFKHFLGFHLLEDTVLNNKKRWVVVSPDKTIGTGLLLAKAVNPVQKEAIGNQSGERVFMFLETSNFWQDYYEMLGKKVDFIEEPRQESYGIVVVFKDLYGNKWDLLQKN